MLGLIVVDLRPLEQPPDLGLRAFLVLGHWATRKSLFLLPLNFEEENPLCWTLLDSAGLCCNVVACCNL